MQHFTWHTYETDLTVIEGDEAHLLDDLKLVVDFQYEHPWTDDGELLGGSAEVYQLRIRTPDNSLHPCPDWLEKRLIDDTLIETLTQYAEAA